MNLKEIIMKTQTIIALKFLLVMTILTGIIYPLLMTGVAQLSFPSKANGSLIMKDGKIIGSELIGQNSTALSISGQDPQPLVITQYHQEHPTMGQRVIP
jgi:K+-transporting ATPase c subunit